MIDVVSELQDYGVQVDVHDPWAVPEEARAEYGLDFVQSPAQGAYDGVTLAVAHDAYRDKGAAALRAYGREAHVFCDVKSVFGRDASDLRL